MSQKTFHNYSARVSIVSLLILILVLLVSSCAPAVVGEYREAATLPEGAEKWQCSGSDGSFTCGGSRLSLSGLPNGEGYNVIPYLFPILPEHETALSNLPKDGDFLCLAMVGNLVFYDDNKDKARLVTTFDKPVTLTINFTEGDLEKLSDCSVPPKSVADVMPVFLYMPNVDASINIWKPFQNFTIEGDQAKIQFRLWGDRPIGWGTPAASSIIPAPTN